MFRNRLCIDGGLTLFMPPTSAAQTVCGKTCQNFLTCCLLHTVLDYLLCVVSELRKFGWLIPSPVHKVFVSESAAIVDGYLLWWAESDIYFVFYSSYVKWARIVLCMPNSAFCSGPSLNSLISRGCPPSFMPFTSHNSGGLVILDLNVAFDCHSILSIAI